MPTATGLTVAVTGPTGTFGFGLMPLLEADPRVARVVGMARHAFDPGRHGWSKMTYRQGDVRDPAALEDAFRGVDVVVHLAFRIVGTGSPEATRSVNVDGTVNVFRASVAAGVSRFVYASSVAAYAFHPDNPVGITEDWPIRGADRLRYSQDKAEIERLLRGESAAHPEVATYVLRPPIVLGPHLMGGKAPAALRPFLHGAGAVGRRWPLAVPVALPPLPLQFIHEDDVGTAFLQCIVAAGPPGAYNIAGDGVITLHDVARELSLRPVPVPLGPAQRVARGFAAVPLPSFLPPVTEWSEVLSHPLIVDTGKAKRELGWQPRFTGLAALRATVHPERDD